MYLLQSKFSECVREVEADLSVTFVHLCVCVDDRWSVDVQLDYRQDQVMPHTVNLHIGTSTARPKKNPVFRATRPYLSEPADPRFFFTKIPCF